MKTQNSKNWAGDTNGQDKIVTQTKREGIIGGFGENHAQHRIYEIGLGAA